jgi:hypothetical protein
MYSECVFVKLRVHHTMRMRRIILSFVACPVVQYFAPLSHKWHYFLKKKIVEWEPICSMRTDSRADGQT